MNAEWRWRVGVQQITAIAVLRQALLGQREREDGAKVWATAQALEDAVYRWLGSFGAAPSAHDRQQLRRYRTRVIELALQLGGERGGGESWVSKLLAGQVSAERVATMDHRDMAPAQLYGSGPTTIYYNSVEGGGGEGDQKKRVGGGGGKRGGMYRCRQRSCGSWDVHLWQLQTRSADEGMTTYVECNECGSRYKF